MQIDFFAYTTNVNRLLTLPLTIVVAVFVGFIVASNQTQAYIDRLISSPSVTDQLRGISLLTNASFDTLNLKLCSILNDKSTASKKAQELLVTRAFQENRIDELQYLDIEDELVEAAVWWDTPREKRMPFPQIVIEGFNPSPWVMKLMAHYDSSHSPAWFPDLARLPLRDRDGSVLLSVLAINNIAPQKIEELIEAWSIDYDLDRQKAAVLLSAIRNLPPPSVSEQNETITTLQTIINEKDIELAWRAMHKSDGSINPDIALAAMIVNQEKFTPILIETAKEDKWTHPEHAILIAESFKPNITNQISFELLKNTETRQKWWSLFACGLLQEER
jgi:hypothetical protein